MQQINQVVSFVTNMGIAVFKIVKPRPITQPHARKSSLEYAVTTHPVKLNVFYLNVNPTAKHVKQCILLIV